MKNRLLLISISTFVCSFTFAQLKTPSEKMEDVKCELTVPNNFTLDYDGMNDCLMVEYNCPITSFELMIYNRWGEKIFESEDINDCWDGSFKGQMMPAGVYMWVLSLESKGEVISEKGSVSLLR